MVLGMVCLAAVVVLAGAGPVEAALAAEDFSFTGPLGSEGAAVEQTGPDRFRITLSHAPEHPDWANMPQLKILRHARGSALRLDFQFHHEKPIYLFDDYFVSFSTDGRNWQALEWLEPRNGKQNSLQLPQLEADTVEIGYQVPMSYRSLMGLIREWSAHPAVQVEEIGRSLGHRQILRLRITEPGSPHPESRRWVHYIGNEHPCEHNARWRMAGMVDWLLSEDGRDARSRSIFCFTMMMSPDSVSKGWYRVNAEGVDMNRSYRAAGADAGAQAHEAWVRQKALEDMMASSTPADTVWAMHTWQGIVEPLLCALGPEFQEDPDSWQRLRDAIAAHDHQKLIKPLAVRETISDQTAWNRGPNVQFGVSTFLVEGAGSILTLEENRQTGIALIRGMTDFYSGIKPPRTEGR